MPFAVILMLALSGCSSLPRSQDEATIDSSKIVVRAAPVIDDVGPWADQFALMALFAKTAYRPDLENGSRLGNGCKYLETKDKNILALHMPVSPIPNAGWTRWDQAGSCIDSDGLFFETYVYKNAGTIEMAVIAFRGTENTTLEDGYLDWAANLSSLLPFYEDEYELARQHAIPVIEKLSKLKTAKAEAIPVFLTGHSLGGGLAQYIAYIADTKVKATYTFDTSPFTHWSYLCPDQQTHDPLIYRIYDEKEALENMRKDSTRFNLPRYHRSDYSVRFAKTDDMFEAHAMSYLTCGFAKNMTGDNNLFHYSKDNAAATLKDKQLCPEN